jgi:phosphoenolpyruvate carboxykinase (ATP)
MATETKPVPGAPDSTNGLEQQGLRPSGEVHWNLVAPELMLAAARRGEGEFADMGPFVAVTSPHTGRSPTRSPSCSCRTCAAAPTRVIA